MPSTFQARYFADVNLNDPFFDSLKSDYPEFELWFKGKADKGTNALVYLDGDKIGAFIYLKQETEEIPLQEGVLPAIERIKIGTLKLDESIRNKRLGEGALGLCLWHWRDAAVQQIYVTVYSKQEALIKLLEKFGFYLAGHKENNECVYIKDKNEIDVFNPLLSFPFLPSTFEFGGILPIQAKFHDELFPYSELQNVRFEQSAIENVAGNGVTKIYIATPASILHYYPGEPIIFYRMATENKQFRSVVTSYGRITRCSLIRTPYDTKMTYEDYRALIGNKSIFDDGTLLKLYNSHKNVYVLEMVYCGFFGAGHNVNFRTLQGMGLFPDQHPYQIKYCKEDFKKILEMGGINVQDAFID